MRSRNGKAVVSLTTGLEDPEKVTVAFLVAVGAAEQRRPTLMFLTEAPCGSRLDGVVRSAPPARAARRCTELARRFAGARVAGLPGAARSASPRGSLGRGSLVKNAALGGTVQLWEWIGDEPATTFSY